MRTHAEALLYSMHHPTEVVEFKDLGYNTVEYWSGFFLNREREGVFIYVSGSVLQYRNTYNSKTQQSEHLLFKPDGSISRHFFKQRLKMHGECLRLNEDGSVDDHYFYNSNTRVEELDELLDAERDDAFYVTLALCGIDKEYTFK